MRPFTNLSPMQLAHLQHFVEGRVVHDLGAGDLTYAHDLTVIGAKHVIAIDKEPATNVYGKVTFQRRLFADVRDDIDVAFMSWPSNYDSQIEVPASRARTLIYIGKNTDATVCGSPALFDLLLHRDLVTYIPAQRNVLLVCQGVLDKPRRPTGDEWAGMHLERIYSFNEAEERALAVV